MPLGVVTVTSTVLPAVPAGLVAVIALSLTTVKFVAAVVPKSTAVAPDEVGAGDRHRKCHRPPGRWSGSGP